MKTDLSGILAEKKISMADLAKEIDVSLPTIWRWCQRGVRGVRLETYKQGGRRFTTWPAYRRFIEAGTQAADSNTTAPQRETNRQAAARKNGPMPSLQVTASS